MSDIPYEMRDMLSTGGLWENEGSSSGAWGGAAGAQAATPSAHQQPFLQDVEPGLLQNINPMPLPPNPTMEQLPHGPHEGAAAAAAAAIDNPPPVYYGGTMLHQPQLFPYFRPPHSGPPSSTSTFGGSAYHPHSGSQEFGQQLRVRPPPSTDSAKEAMAALDLLEAMRISPPASQPGTQYDGGQQHQQHGGQHHYVSPPGSGKGVHQRTRRGAKNAHQYHQKGGVVSPPGSFSGVVGTSNNAGRSSHGSDRNRPAQTSTTSKGTPAGATAASSSGGGHQHEMVNHGGSSSSQGPTGSSFDLAAAPRGVASSTVVHTGPPGPQYRPPRSSAPTQSRQQGQKIRRDFFQSGGSHSSSGLGSSSGKSYLSAGQGTSSSSGGNSFAASSRQGPVPSLGGNNSGGSGRGTNRHLTSTSGSANSSWHSQRGGGAYPAGPHSPPLSHGSSLGGASNSMSSMRVNVQPVTLGNPFPGGQQQNPNAALFAAAQQHHLLQQQLQLQQQQSDPFYHPNNSGEFARYQSGGSSASSRPSPGHYRAVAPLSQDSNGSGGAQSQGSSLRVNVGGNGFGPQCHHQQHQQQNRPMLADRPTFGGGSEGEQVVFGVDLQTPQPPFVAGTAAPQMLRGDELVGWSWPAEGVQQPPPGIVAVPGGPPGVASLPDFLAGPMQETRLGDDNMQYQQLLHRRSETLAAQADQPMMVQEQPTGDIEPTHGRVDATRAAQHRARRRSVSSSLFESNTSIDDN
ncbi:unnamed protein product [Amoebophrya sp. A120]|nr:unnamed protein product [Amoebophrya sp. A120]|eukprot:GSA120T00015776001.1